MLKALKKKISVGSWQPFKFRSEDKRLMGDFMVCVRSRFCLYKVSLTDIQEINSGTPECLVGFFSDLLLQRLIYSTVKICDF